MCTVKFKNGNLLDAPELMKVHQVNCKGVMGGGIAKQIKERYPLVYKTYLNLCKRKKDDHELLGNAQTVRYFDDDQVFINLFSQYDYGTDKQQTDYAAMEEGLNKLKYILNYVDEYRFYDEIAFPHSIGCGLAGGNWDIVQSLIFKVFEDWDGTIVFYKL